MMDRKQLVVVNQSAGYLMVDIHTAFSSKYNHQILLCGSLAIRNKPLPQNVEVIKLTPYNRSSTFRRIVSWIQGFLKSCWLIGTRFRKADLFLVSNPPLNLFIPFFFKNSSSLLVYDIYPDVFVEMGVFEKNSLIVRAWRKLNVLAFRKVKTIFTISEGMKNLLIQYTDPDKIHVVPLWTDNSFLRPLRKQDNIFLREQNLVDKFIVLYSGNLGRTHEVDVLIQLAHRCTHPLIFFLIIGEGEQKFDLQRKIDDLQLNNCRLLSWQPPAMLPYTLSSADVAVVTLGKKASSISVPSKTYNYLSVGSPLLCIAQENSELHQLVSHYQVGACFDVEQEEQMVNFILTLAANPEQHAKLRQKALMASADFTAANSHRFVEQIFDAQ